MLLRDSPHRGAADWDLVEGLLAVAAGGPAGPAAEVAELVARARTLGPRVQPFTTAVLEEQFE